MFKRFFAILHARNLEFVRDKASLSWSVAFPLLILVGFAFIFDDGGRPVYKVGVLGERVAAAEQHFLSLKHIEYVDYQDQAKAILKLQQHALDLLVEPSRERYWVNISSPKGYFAEQLLQGIHPTYHKHQLSGREIRYLDWVVPGILGMNMMFGCLFGVGYVIVRYRKNAVLKRLKATPLSAFEFLLAQVVSRLLIVVIVTTGIFLGCHWMFDFYILGSLWLLLLIAILGAISMISLGLLVACRSRSEELTGGLLNLVTWPMMVLSGVWFSLEGAPVGVQYASQLFPLTHVLSAARSVMTDGAGAMEILPQLTTLTLTSVVLLLLASVLFQWDSDGR